MFHRLVFGGVYHELLVGQVKPLVHKLVKILADEIPAMTEEQATRANTCALIRVRDRFFASDIGVKYAYNKKTLQAAFNLLISHYDYDHAYREPIDECVELLLEAVERGEWERKQNREAKK